MWYRTYLGSLSKKKYKETKDMNAKQIQKFLKLEWYDEDDDFVSPNDILDKPYLFEFGKYIGFKNLNKQENLYPNIDFEWDFKAISKQDLLEIADVIRWFVYKYYSWLVFATKCKKNKKQAEKIITKEMEKPFKKINFDKVNLYEQMFLYHKSPKDYIKKELEKKQKKWSSMKNIQAHFLWEYYFFDLLAIAEYFDFENNYLIYYWY